MNPSPYPTAKEIIFKNPNPNLLNQIYSNQNQRISLPFKPGPYLYGPRDILSPNGWPARSHSWSIRVRKPRIVLHLGSSMTWASDVTVRVESKPSEPWTRTDHPSLKGNFTVERNDCARRQQNWARHDRIKPQIFAKTGRALPDANSISEVR